MKGLFSREWKNRQMCILTGPALLQISLQTKKNLALAQFGNLPDGLFNAGMNDYDLLRYAKQGIIIPLENLIDKYMPNLQKVFEQYPEYRTMCTAPDGHIYSFPWIEQLGGRKRGYSGNWKHSLYQQKNGWII